MQRQKIHHWMEKNLEEPFLRAELARAEMGSNNFLKGATLLGSISVLTITILALVIGN